MAEETIGYHEDPVNSNGIVRARAGKQIRSWQIPRQIKSLEKLNGEMGKNPFPGNYVLFAGTTAYAGEASDVYERLKTHFKTPEDKIKNWDRALVISDGRPATQSDFNDTVIRQALELHLIKVLKANKYRIVSQGRQATLNAGQMQMVISLKQELDYFLLKKNIILKVLEEEGQQEVFGDELKRLLKGGGKKIQEWSAYEATIDGRKAYIRPGSRKEKGWQITFRDRFLDSLKNEEGYLLVSRNGVLLIPLSEVRKVVTDINTFKQNTIDVYIVFTPERVTLAYKDKTIDLTAYRLRR